MAEQSKEHEVRPSHLRLASAGLLKWDWRKENGAEILFLIFFVCMFFLLPRAGCGITSTKPAPKAQTISAPSPGAGPAAEKADKANGAAKR